MELYPAYPPENQNGLNALHLASKEGHVNIVTELLKRGANVDAATKKGNTALHIASLAGQEEIVKILVQNGAKVNVQSQNGFTPLYMAAQENHADVVKFLLSNGASQSLATEDGFTPLAVALQQGHDKVVTVLLENDTRGRVKLPALHIAAKKDDVKAATLLLQNEHVVDSTSKSGFTPLHIAAHYGNQNVGALLIEKGADTNFKARNAITPLHVASKWGRTNMVTLLLDSGANINCATRDGLTPLHCAARSGHDHIVELLLSRGAPVTSKTKNGLSPLHMSAQGDHVECARQLLQHKAPIDDVTVDYLTPLHVAAHCGNVRTAKLLLDRKCEVNARALNGFTPLHIACKKNRIKVVELLLKYGASIEATTESGLTPLHVSAFMGHMNIVIYLIQHGANPDTQTVRGETALHLAARANQTDIIRILLRNGAQVDARAREQQTPLHIASRLGNVDNVVLLLQHGASPDATTKDLYTPLHIAAKEGHEEVAAALLEHGANQNLTTKKGFTPLHIAAKYGNIKVARLLLQKEADPNIQGKNGLTPLHVATHYNNVNVALLLLENGASPHCTAKNGYTPLHIAAKKNQMDIATTLLEYHADPNAESKNGFSPLHLASQEGHTDMASLLLEHKANVNCRAKNGLTPMHLAAQEDKVPVAEVLVKYGSEIDPQTKAGYTPLHTACHFGQINMIRFLLEHGAAVNATTKLGYTPLHQAAQQGHVLVINLLLKYKASPNAVSNTGQTPLSIAQRLGYISVVEILRHVTEVQVPDKTADEKYKVVSPETMQETLMTDSEDEGGEDTIIGDQSISMDDFKFLADDSITPRDEFSTMDRFSTLASTTGMSVSSAGHPHDDSREIYRQHDDSAYPDVFARPESLSYPPYGRPESLSYPPYGEEKLQQSMVPQQYSSKPGMLDAERPPMYGSYSGASFSSSFDPDNIAIDRHPIYSGFLVSFMVDARGGAMRGCRHSGVRIIVPPAKACMPTRVTCKLVKKEKLTHPPPLMEGEALASRVLEMGPVGAKFLGPVIIEVPHFASLRGKEREIVILRSDNGETWREHSMEATEEAIHDALNGSFEGEDLESAEELYNKRITRILTSDFPHYFAIVTRIRQETKTIGPEAGMLSSTVVPQVQAVFPEGSLTKKIKVGLQAQPLNQELVAKMLGNRVAVSPIVTVEPRRRKFHKPITLTIPLPQAKKGMINQYGQEAPTLRLLCSITGGTTPAQWEDITGTTPLTFVNDCASFTTTVSARFWLMDCQNINEAAKMATELYREAIAVPFMAKFVVFAKHHAPEEARLRVFCMTDDKMDKTLETQEHFQEIARSRDVEVLEGKPQFIEMAGNLTPVTKTGDQLYINFHAFRENRLPLLVRVRDGNQEPVGRLAFMREPRVGRGEAPQTPICNLNVKLPDTIRGEPVIEMDDEMVQQWQQKFDAQRGGPTDENISKAELRLTDIADTVQGDWVMLARQLNITDDEIAKIQGEYTYVSEQALVMLHLWVQKNEGNATGNELERALRKIGREDVIRKCMYNIEEVTDEVERAVAKVHIDQAEPETLENGIAPIDADTVPRDEDVAVLGAEKPPVDDKRDRKLEIEGQVHPGDEGQRRRSSSGSSYDSDGEKNEGTYTSPDYADRYEGEEDARPDDLSPIDERKDRERDSYISQPDDKDLDGKPGYDEPDERDQNAFPGETDLDAVPDGEITVETNLDDVPAEEKEKPDENFNVAPRSPKRKYQSSSESEPEEEPEKYGEDDDTGKDVDRIEETPVGDTGDDDEKKPDDEEARPDGKDVDSDVDEKKSKSSASDDEEKFEDIKDDINDDKPQEDDEPKDDDKDKPGFDAFKEELGPSRDSTLPRGVSLDVSYDEQDIMKESESAGDSGSETGSVKRAEEEPPAMAEDETFEQDDDVIVAKVDERHGVLKKPTEEEELQAQREREEAYDILTKQLQDQAHEDDLKAVVDEPDFQEPVKETLIHEESRQHRPAEVNELIEAVEGYQVKGMDDRRLSESSEDSMIIRDEARPKDGMPVDARDSPRVVPTPPPSPTEDLADAQEQGLSDKELAARLADTESLTTNESTSTLDAAPVLEELASPTDSIDSEKPSVRVYTDTIEGEPQVETDVQEFEETMPDGTVVKRKVIKTRQKQTIVKRVVMEGPESDLPTTEEQAQMMLNTSGSFEPEVQVYTDRMQTEPVESTDVQEFEETLPDGTVVKKKVVTKTEQQLKTERTLMEGSDAVMGLADGHDEDMIQAEDQSYAHGAPDRHPQAEVPVHVDGQHAAPHVSIPDESAMLEDISSASPATMTSEGTLELEDVQDSTWEVLADEADTMLAEQATLGFHPQAPDGADDILIGDEGELDEAAGGEMQSTRVVMKKQIHKKTIIKDGQEETIVTEDTHVEQDNETPEDIKESVQDIIDEFMESGGAPRGALPPSDS